MAKILYLDTTSLAVYPRIEQRDNAWADVSALAGVLAGRYQEIPLEDLAVLVLVSAGQADEDEGFNIFRLALALSREKNAWEHSFEEKQSTVVDQSDQERASLFRRSRLVVAVIPLHDGPPPTGELTRYREQLPGTHRLDYAFDATESRDRQYRYEFWLLR